MNAYYASILAFAGALSLQHAGAASYTVYSNVADVGGTYVNFDLSKFDSNLGTLTGVQVSVVQSDLVGSATITDNALTSLTVTGFDSAYTVKGVTAGLGYNQNSKTIYEVVTTPDWNVTTIDPSTAETFTIDGGQSFSPSSQAIAAENFSTYSSAGGTGTVRFAAKNTQSIGVTGGTYSVNSDAVKTTSQIAITYTYTAITPVPEPGSWLIVCGGLGAGLFVRRRRA